MDHLQQQAAIDIDQIVAEIRSKIARLKQFQFDSNSLPADPGESQPEERDDAEAAVVALLNKLKALSDSCGEAAERIGQLPPTPPTFRGRRGRQLITLLQRLLWWYTAPMRRYAAILEQRQAAIQELFSLVIRNRSALVQRARTAGEIEGLRSEVKRLEARIEAAANAEQQVAGVRSAIDDLSRQLERTRVDASHGLAEVRALDSKLSDIGVFSAGMRDRIDRIEARISVLLEDARRAKSSPATNTGHGLHREGERQLERFYLDFENVFRGPYEEIQSRFKVYLPVLAQHGVGSEAMPVLDLGCGRGEWLDLLRSRNLDARGVDSNGEMVNSCAERGLQVTTGEVLQTLRSTADCSLGAVTAFHVVEHLSFEDAMALILESFRVLRPGGLLILETPNPRNLLVASHNFYLDPTHRRPIPSDTLKFLVEAWGFCSVEVIDLHPSPDWLLLPPEAGPVAQRFNEHFYGAQDYAIVGRKV